MHRHASSILNGLVVCLLNLGGVWAGFMIWAATGVANQVALQVPIAFVLSVAGVLAWTAISKRFARHVATGVVFVSAMIWAVVVFVPLHRATTGYWTSFGNILGIWVFQLPANALALIMLPAWLRRRDVEASAD